MPFLRTQYLRVTEKDILPVEIHCLENSSTHTGTGSWLEDRHVQEILQLLRDTIFLFVGSVNTKGKPAASKQHTVSGILTGTSVRAGYIFKKRPGNQLCLVPSGVLSLDDYEVDSLSSLHVLREKLVVYTHPLVSGSPGKMARLMKVVGDKKRTSGQGVSISSYFQKIPSSQSGSQSAQSSQSACDKEKGKQSTQSGSQLSLLSQFAYAPGKQLTKTSTSTVKSQPGSHLSPELQTTSETVADNQSTVVIQSASSLPEAPPSDGPRHKIKNILERGEIGATKRKGRKVRVAKSTGSDKFTTNDLKENLPQLNASDNSKGSDHVEQMKTKVPADRQIAPVSLNDEECCIIDGIKISKVSESYPNFNEADCATEDSVTLISVEQMLEIQKNAGISPEMSKSSLVSPECRSNSSSTGSKSCGQSCDQAEPLFDESILPSASFCTQSVTITAISTTDLLKGIGQSADKEADDDVKDSPKFCGKKDEKVRTYMGCLDSQQRNTESPTSQFSTKESDNDDSSTSLTMERKKNMKYSRYKRKFPSFSDSDSEDSIQENKIPKKNGAQNQTKFVKLDQMKMTSKKISLSKSFFTGDSNKAQQPTLSFFMNKGGKKQTAEMLASDDSATTKDDMNDIDCELIKELSDVPKVKNEADIELKNEIRSLSSVKGLNDEHLRYMIRNNERYLRSIFEGKVHCQRHQCYKLGGRSRRDLNYESRIGQYSEEQVDVVMECLMSIFCKRHHKYLDYIMKVLLPEMLIKLHMDMQDTSHEESEKMLAPKTSSGSQVLHGYSGYQP